MSQAFDAKYDSLEKRMIHQIRNDEKELDLKCVYLPNIRPVREVDYILVALEPIIATRNIENDKEKFRRFTELCNGGFKNFIWSSNDAVLHFCAYKYLCSESMNYYITDISKGAMTSDDARKEKTQRYKRWRSLLEDEIDLVSENQQTRIVAIGTGGYPSRIIEGKRAGMGKTVSCKILHYSDNNTPRFREEVRSSPDGHRLYESFKKTFDHQHFLEFFREQILSPNISRETQKLAEEFYGFNPFVSLRKQISDSQLMRAFVYKREFDQLHRNRPDA